jgi:hypothetical protein
MTATLGNISPGEALALALYGLVAPAIERCTVCLSTEGCSAFSRSHRIRMRTL